MQPPPAQRVRIQFVYREPLGVLTLFLLFVAENKAMLGRLMSRVNGMKLPAKRSRLPLTLVPTTHACVRGSHIARFAFYVRVLEADFHLNSVRSRRRLALGRNCTSLARSPRQFAREPIAFAPEATDGQRSRHPRREQKPFASSRIECVPCEREGCPLIHRIKTYEIAAPRSPHSLGCFDFENVHFRNSESEQNTKMASQ